METETIRKIDDNTMAIDTVKVNTETFNLTFLQSQKQQLETDLARVNDLLAQFEDIKQDEPQLEAIKLEDVIGDLSENMVK